MRDPFNKYVIKLDVSRLRPLKLERRRTSQDVSFDCAGVQGHDWGRRHMMRYIIVDLYVLWSIF